MRGSRALWICAAAAASLLIASLAKRGSSGAVEPTGAGIAGSQDPVSSAVRVPHAESLQAIQRRVEELLPRVAEIHGAHFQRPVTVRALDSTGQPETAPGPIGPEAGLFLEAIGVAEPAMRRTFPLVSYGGADTIWVRPAAIRALTDRILVHELVHALDDQCFGLVDRYRRLTTTDARLALRAALEGSAELTAAEFVGREGAESALRPIVADAAATGSIDLAERATERPTLLGVFLSRLFYGNGLAWAHRKRDRARWSVGGTLSILFPDSNTVALADESPKAGDRLGAALSIYVLARLATSGDREFSRLFGGDAEHGIALRGPLARIAWAYRGDSCLVVSTGTATGAQRIVWTTLWGDVGTAARVADLLDGSSRRTGCEVTYSITTGPGGDAGGAKSCDSDAN